MIFPRDGVEISSRCFSNNLARKKKLPREGKSDMSKLVFSAFYCQYFFFMENLNTSVEIIRYTMLCIHKVVISGSICDISAPMVFTFTKHSAADAAGNM